MAIYREDLVAIELESGSIFRSFLKHSIGLGDAAANRFGVKIYRNGAAETLSGVTCQGFFQDANGQNIALTSHGTVSGNVAYVTLPQACYNVEGRFTLAIKLVGGGVTGTMRIVDGVVDNTNTSSPVAPTGSVPTYQEVLSVFEQMQTALSNYNAKVTEQDNKINLKADLSVIAPAFYNGTNYVIGQYVTYDGKFYRFTSDHPAGEWNSAHVSEVFVGPELEKIDNNWRADVGNLKSAITAFGEIVVVPYDYSSIATDKINISSSNKWNSNNNYRAYYFQIPAGAKTLTVKGNETNGSSIALLAASDTHTHGDTPVYATGWSKTFVPSGTEQTYNIPSDAKYAWFLKTSNGVDYEPAFYGFNADLSNVPKIPEIEETVEEMQGYLPHNVQLISISGLSTGKYIDTDVGSNWTNGLTDNSGSLYTSAAIDVSDYYGDTLIIEIGSNDAHTGVRESGFCNANNIVSSVVQEHSLPYQSEDGYLKARISITDKYFFFSCSGKSHLSISIDAEGTLVKECQVDTKYVATDGNDDNDGTYVSPFATINKALESGARCVAIKGGTYKQRIDLSLSKKSSLSIVNATVTGKVTLMSPDCVIAESETAVDGYTKVYSVETTKTFADNNVWIFQDGVADESTMISVGKRMPEQRGKAYRCYDTKIKKTSATVLSDALTEIENSESYKWFKDGTTLYFSRPSAVSPDNPICGSFNTNLFSNGARKISLNVSGIDVKYMCFNVKYTSNSRIVDCSCMNVYGDGAFCFDGSDCLELIRCEAARAYSGTNGDGFNAHSSYDGYAFAHQTTAVLIDCWSHDNNDDGISLHERSEFTVIGGLFEQNYYGGGITPANGSHCTCIGVYARDNGEGGFLYMNPTSVGEGGVGGQIKCIDCVSESNNIWASATSAGYKINSAGNKGILIGCKAIGEDNGYYVADNDGAMTLIDCGALNCSVVKGGKTANITVQNTTLVN